MEDGENCILAKDGDVEHAAEQLGRAVRMILDGQEGELVRSALRTAARFSPGREASGLLRFWKGFLARTAPMSSGSGN